MCRGGHSGPFEYPGYGESRYGRSMADKKLSALFCPPTMTGLDYLIVLGVTR